ncbi:hypothetical protein V492_01284, partial [Pseudogymnoascus sp. VKM F-4246]
PRHPPRRRPPPPNQRPHHAPPPPHPLAPPLPSLGSRKGLRDIPPTTRRPLSPRRLGRSQGIPLTNTHPLHHPPPRRPPLPPAAPPPPRFSRARTSALHHFSRRSDDGTRRHLDAVRGCGGGTDTGGCGCCAGECAGGVGRVVG